MTDDFDLVVLGGGHAGYAAALYGASAGLHIAMVEEQRVGGTCLHRGCIPAKELLQTAEVLRTVRDAAAFGVRTSEPTLELGASQTRKHAVIDRLTGGLETLLKGRKVTVVPGTGTLAPDARTVHVSDGSQLRADAAEPGMAQRGSHADRADAAEPGMAQRGSHAIRGRNVLLATGSSPRSLPVRGLEFDGERVLSSDDVLEIAEVPRRVAVVGGGAIGCEFASFLVDAGAEVTIVEVLPQILPGVDQQVAQAVARAFTKRGIKVQAGVQVRGFDGAALTFEGRNGEERLEVDAVVVSVGRRPRSENIGLDGAGVKVDERGFVVVDGNLRTNVDGVYAAGDVVATPQLAHVAFSEAIVAIKTMLGEQPLPI